LSGERIVLTTETRNLSLAGKHEALSDLPIAGLRVGVLSKIEIYLMDANHVNKKELARRTPFFSRDQRDHIVEEVKAEWATRRPYQVDGYQVVSYVREGNKNVSLQYSFRDLKTGKFARPEQKEEEDAQ
jgi:hypothetical protein